MINPCVIYTFLSMNNINGSLTNILFYKPYIQNILSCKA